LYSAPNKCLERPKLSKITGNGSGNLEILVQEQCKQ